MSKKRPSARAGTAADARTSGADVWRRRVFHNTYTRNGRSNSVRGWSVKLQFQGRRRTFSLASKTRSQAASEARRIHDALRADGWEMLSQAGPGQPARKNDPLYWKGRLRLRQYGPGIAVQYSARIDYAGQNAYFPLGSSDPDEAAARAINIFRRVARQGWQNVRASLSYELTIGFHWVANPLLWSYTTLQTPGEFPKPGLPHGGGREAGARRSLPRVVVLEPNTEIRDALVYCLSREVGVDCAAFRSAGEWKECGTGLSPSLCLVNLESSESLLSPGALQMSVLPNGVNTLPYSVHVDSDELFLAAPGGLSGYCFKRLLPCDILKPVLGLVPTAQSATTLLRAVQDFFQGVAQIPSAAPDALPRRALFTPREHEVLALLSKGYVDKEIARDLGISVWTVHEHVKRVFEKLGVHSRLEATLAYLQK